MSYAPTTDSLDQPLYGATFGQAFSRFWRKYVVFSGRASRSEYWWVTLLGFVVTAVFQVLDVTMSGGFRAAQASSTSIGDLLSYLWGLATIIPSLALSVRRLHDGNHSGFWILIGLVPLVGWIVLLVFYLSGPDPAGQRFDRGTGTSLR